MTQSQVNWAMQHDWYSSSYDGIVWAIESSPQAGLVPFNDYQLLRQWAGY